ncbi:MAG: hypothetical protein NZ585_01270 [Chloracidobacterium sp.]|nr:hypothetical protein [Chloracidobacterium sp.]MDW8216363.1 hypothetical protein [Acidobacteriota bacterium]
MSSGDLLQRFFVHRLIASLRAATAEIAVQSAQAVVEGGIRIVEVPYTTPGAMRVIVDIRRRFGDEVVVGIGDAPSIEIADRAIKANAQFVTLPYDNAPLVEFCRKHRLLVIPAGATPREVALVAEQGAALVRVFPAAAFGGAVYIGHLRRALPEVHLLAAGGVDLNEVPNYFRAGASVVAIGGGLFSPQTDATPNFDHLTERARRLVTALSTPSA